jgi:phosphatidylserine/phosphatidylglycerophosphate/cardiolipin synthase-like enzyme
VVKRFSFVIIAFAVLYGILIKTALSPSLPSPSNPLILYSNQSQDDLRLILKKTFLQASHSLSIWMYAATDPLLLRLLQKRADQGIHIDLRFDKRGGTPPLDPSLHPQILKSKGLMHRKIVIADKKIVFLGSANMTTSSLQLHDNLSVGLYHPGVAAFLDSPHQKNYSFQIGTTSALLWLLPDPQALLQIKKQIDEAHSSLFVAMFTLTQKDLIDTLISAHERGVSVTVVLDRYTANGASKKAVQKLSSAGIDLFFSANLPLLHHKWAYIDEKALILGSTNWTEAAFAKNDDILLFLSALPKSLQSQVKSLISAIKMESKKYP